MRKLSSTDRATLVLGAACGSRSMVGPTIVSHALRQRASGARQPARALAHPRATALLDLLAAGEIVGDKLPGIPARISPPALAGRIATGALVGASIAAVSGGRRLRGALIGGVAAAVSAVVTYELRQFLGTRAHIPDGLLAVAEDAIVLRASSRASARVRRAAARR